MLRVVLLAMLLLVPGSCARQDSDKQRSSSSPSDLQDVNRHIEASLDPFITGSSYRIVMRVAEKEPGLGQKSTATLRISLGGFSSDTDTETETDTDTTDTNNDTNTNSNNDTATDTEEEDRDDVPVVSGDPSETFVADTKMRVEWSCGEEQHRGYKDVSIRSIRDELSVRLDDLPALQDADDSFRCDVNVALDTTLVDGERVIATGSEEFYLEINAPALQIHEVEIAADTDNTSISVVDFKVVLMRKGEAVKSGDHVFDNKVTVAFTWECNDSAKSKSPNKTYLDIAAGKGEGAAQLRIPNRPQVSAGLGEPGYACLIVAKSDIEGYETKLGSKKIWIEGKDLQVAVTEVTSGSLRYAVMVRYQKLAGNVSLSVVGDNCSGVTLADNANNVASSGAITISSGSGTGCKLRATADTSATEQRIGESKAFDIPIPPEFREGE